MKGECRPIGSNGAGVLRNLIKSYDPRTDDSYLKFKFCEDLCNKNTECEAFMVTSRGTNKKLNYIYS